MKRSFGCSNALRVAALALLGACSGTSERADGASPAEADTLSANAALDAGIVVVDAGSDAGGAPVDAGLPMGSRPRDRCSPSGEGDLPWAPCDTARGLVCVAPDRAQLDAPSTCRCPAGRVFTEGACVAQ